NHLLVVVTSFSSGQAFNPALKFVIFEGMRHIPKWVIMSSRDHSKHGGIISDGKAYALQAPIMDLSPIIKSNHVRNLFDRLFQTEIFRPDFGCITSGCIITVNFTLWCIRKYRMSNEKRRETWIQMSFKKISRKSGDSAAADPPKYKPMTGSRPSTSPTGQICDSFDHLA